LDDARVSYHAQTGGTGLRAIAAVVLNTVLQEYESAFRDAGLQPRRRDAFDAGRARAADAEKPTLVVKVDARSIGIAILDQDQVLLFRTLENVRGVTISGEQLAEEVYPSVVFFQDTYNLNIDRIYVAGLPETVGAAPALKAQTARPLQNWWQLRRSELLLAQFRAGGWLA